MAKQRLQLTWYNKDKALIPTEAGKYGYTWVDPDDPRYCETHTLIYDDYVHGKQTPKSEKFHYSERADLQPQEDNLLILGESGDVLEALTRVPELAEKYVGQVKLIYIDPPFNTGEMFESYEDNLEHSIWLTMMRDRLIHMRKLLADDGSIWVHLDDAEVHRMRILMDEIFGSGNFVAEIVWQKVYSPKMDNSKISTSHDSIIIFRKTSQWIPNPLTGITPAVNFPFEDENGKYATFPLRKWGHNSLRSDAKGGWFGITAPNGEVVYPIRPDGKEGTWRWSAQKIQKDSQLLVWKEDRTGSIKPYVKQYQTDNTFRPAVTWWPREEVGLNRQAKKHISDLFPAESPFSTPKPEKLMERITHIGSNPGDIVLDVFGGSGTTAAVAQKMGRRWVICELLESNFTTFTRPRLEKVVNDHDPGGITRTKGERVAADGVELPEGVSPEDAAKFASVLKKLIEDDPQAKENSIVKALKASSKTRYTREVVNWRGGGGFQVAHLSPACFDYESRLDRVMLTAAATGDTLTSSVAANLGFTLIHPEDDFVFDGRRGNALLKVVEGVATVEIVDWLAAQVQPGETIVLAATAVMDGVRQHLRKAVKGSRVVALPDDIFRYTKGGEL